MLYLLAESTETITEAAQVAAESAQPLIQEPAGIFAILLAVLATLFWLAKQPALKKFFGIVPVLVFCYFVPTTLTTIGILPDASPLYDWIKQQMLPASLLLLIIALDIPAILRLGPKAGIMLLAGTAGVVIGGPIALLIVGKWLDPEIWRGMSALSGSWIGGGANFVAIGNMAGASPEMIAKMVIPDVFVANIWMGILLYSSGLQHIVDKRTGADTQAIRDLEHRMTEFQERVTRVPTMVDFMTILAFGFVGSWMSARIGDIIPEIGSAKSGVLISHGTWKYVIVTSLGLGLSFTKARNLEGVGASKIGSLMIYLLVACIGAHASFNNILEAPMLIVMALIWMFCHVAVLLLIGRLIRAPLFFVAVASQANIGGAASAPIVASAFHPALAPVGALLAVAGYVLGTYAGWICMQLLKTVAGAT